jgi:hypothetical protein
VQKNIKALSGFVSANTRYCTRHWFIFRLDYDNSEADRSCYRYIVDLVVLLFPCTGRRIQNEGRILVSYTMANIPVCQKVETADQRTS